MINVSLSNFAVNSFLPNIDCSYLYQIISSLLISWSCYWWNSRLCFRLFRFQFLLFCSLFVLHVIGAIDWPLKSHYGSWKWSFVTHVLVRVRTEKVLTLTPLQIFRCCKRMVREYIHELCLRSVGVALNVYDCCG